MKSNKPYLAIVNAFENLINYLLVEKTVVVKKFQEKLLNLLENNGQIIIDLIPNLELILGKQPSVSTLPPSQSKNRLYNTFIKFIKAFTNNSHPLILFLDDLQWADNASLNLIKKVVTSDNIKNLIIIGAYRNNEISSNHTLNLTINQIEKIKNINRILLKPLNYSDINKLITHSINTDPKKVKVLTNLIINKTNGNPFYVKQFLRSLHNENLLYFDYKSQKWYLNLEAIESKEITKNLIQLLCKNITYLNTETIKLLKIAACIGNYFQIYLLSKITLLSSQEIQLKLKEAIIKGLIIPTNKINEYKFIHDRIQKTIYDTSISPQEKSKLHLTIGNLLLKNTPPKHLWKNIFEIADQFNLGRDLITNESEISNLAKLNLIAAKKAKTTAAYQSAFKYLQINIDLLTKDYWEKRYHLTLKIYLEATEIACIVGNFSLMKKWGDTVIIKAKNIPNKLKAYKIIITGLTVEDKLTDCLNRGISALKLLKIKINKDPSDFKVLLELVNVNISLLGKNTDKLSKLPPIKNLKIRLAIEILGLLHSAAYSNNPKLFTIIILKEIKLLVQHGNTSQSAHAYACYATLLSGMNDNIDLADRFGNLSLKLLDKINNKNEEVKTFLTLSAFITHRKNHFNTTFENLEKTYKYGLATENFEYAGYSIATLLFYSFWSGKKLTILENEINECFKSQKQIIQKKSYQYLKNLQSLVTYLRQPSLKSNNLNKSSSIINNLNLNLNLNLPENNDDGTTLFYSYFYQSLLFYLFENYSDAYDRINKAKSFSTNVISSISFYVSIFYESLIKLALFSQNQSEYNHLIKEIKVAQKKIKKWANSAPMNYQHKYDLIQAEIEQLLDNKKEAIELYDKAIIGASKNEFIQEEAIANELAAKFYLKWNKMGIAENYMREAHHKYKLWGAISKVKQLKEKYPELLSDNKISKSKSKSIKTSSTKDTTKIKSENIDMAIVIKTNKTISCEQNLEKLLESILDYSLKAVGAESGSIVIAEEDKYSIKGFAKVTEGNVIQSPSDRIYDPVKFPQSVINYVRRTENTIVLNNACAESQYNEDPYIAKGQIKSLLCLPLLSNGQFIGVIYLENNQNADVFKKDNLGLLELIATQAAISIDNAILRNQRNYVSEYYQLGGSLDPKAPSYVEREADRELYENLISGHYCYLLNARQMGKSSLRVKTTNKLRSEGYKCALVDVSSIGTEQITREEWYFSLIEELEISFPELNNIDLDRELENISNRHSVRIFNYFIEKILLPNIKENIIIFLEEIDCIRNLNFSLNDFFTQIRYFYNCRSDRPEFKRITFVLVGASLSINLLKNAKITPFNIGKKIKLSGFKLENTQPLIAGFKEQCDRPQTVMKEILTWSGGQPFLTQRICNLVKISGNKIPSGNETKSISEIVKNEILNNWQEKDEREHLNTIQTYIINNDEISSNILLKLYKEILLSGYLVYDRSIIEHQELLIIGITKLENNKLIIFNQIYQEIFNLNWVNKYLN